MDCARKRSKVMIVVDIYGSPGSGKSTLAAYVFSKLKMHNVKCELVTEFAKDLVWDERHKALQNQAFVFGNQFYRLSRLENEVDAAIVDSPLLLNILYNKCSKLTSYFYKVVSQVAMSYDSLSYFLPVVENTQYEDVGRVHNEDESKALSCEMLMLLNNYNVKYKVLGHDEESMMSVVDDVMMKLEKMQ